MNSKRRTKPLATVWHCTLVRPDWAHHPISQEKTCRQVLGPLGSPRRASQSTRRLVWWPTLAIWRNSPPLVDLSNGHLTEPYYSRIYWIQLITSTGSRSSLSMSDPHQSPPECQLNTVPGLLGSVLHYNTTCQGTYGGKTNRTDTRPTRFLPSLILSPIDCWCICFWIFWTLITRRCRYPVLYNIKFADGTRYISRLRITVHASRTPQVVCVTTFLRLPHASPDASTSIASTETPGPESYYTSDVGLITFQDPRVHAFSKMQRKTVALDTWADSITLSIPGCYTNPHNTYQQVTLVGIDFLGPDESFASLTSTLAPDPVWETKESPAGTMIAPHPWSDFPASPQAGGDLIAGGFPKTVTHSDLEPPSTSPPPASPQLSNATRLAYEDPDGVSFAMSSLPTWRSFAHSPTPSHASIDDILAGLEPEERPRSPPQVKQKKMATPVVNPPHPLKIPDSVSITIPSSVIRAANSSTNPSDQLARPLSFGAKVEAAQTLLEAVEHHCNSNPQSRHNRFRFADIGLSPDFNDTEFLDKLMTLLAAHFFPDRRARLSRITLSILYNLVNYTLVSEARMLDLVMPGHTSGGSENDSGPAACAPQNRHPLPIARPTNPSSLANRPSRCPTTSTTPATTTFGSQTADFGVGADFISPVCPIGPGPMVVAIIDVAIAVAVVAIVA
ncbi:hypothetical protein BJ085DRAFT_29039 [Dimargaris cristalligena]|uniref:Centrosomal protein CEP104 N-terminal domain-containing protein n=1 Tax=Dimargaris cristalligena TaxID=215637 RepID=A0A4P9ZLH6_9FUNG|nr:hypothetical protein BJ085DRAFT_29039 [Dimargaris cristalligena]|eukprot:RKP33948.1 hypothetical protein BJ085DRAFT_29039 [Dimargaris cristalligena]